VKEEARIQTVFRHGSDLERMDCLSQIPMLPLRSLEDFVEELVVSVLQNDPNPIVRHEAAFVLGQLYSTGHIVGRRSLAALCECAQGDRSVVVRHECAESLGSFRGRKAFVTLQSLLHDPEPDVVVTSLIALDRFKKTARQHRMKKEL
jgi:HEAT repeat protein